MTLQKQLHHLGRRLPRRFYLCVGLVFVCLVAVVAGFVLLGGQGLLVLFPALIIAIPCIRTAVRILRVVVFSSPEKQAVEAAAKAATATTSSTAAVDAFFRSLETTPSSPAKAGTPTATAEPRQDIAWNQAERVVVGHGDRLPVRLQAHPYKDNAARIGVSLYILALGLLIGIGLGVTAVGNKNLPLAPPVLRGVLRVLVFLVGIAIGGVVVWVGWRQLQWLSRLKMELSDYPLEAGENHDIVVSHPDPVALQRVRLQLVCEEDGYAGRGKNNQPLTTTRLVLRQGVPLDPPADVGDFRCGQLEVPLTAVSFSLRLHRVRWQLRARLGFWEARYPVEIQSAPVASSDLATLIGDQPANRVEVGVVSLWIDGDTNLFPPGATLSGGFQVRTHPEAIPPQKFELSVLWRAEKVEGDGSAGTRSKRPGTPQQSEEIGVCHFAEYEPTEEDLAAYSIRRQFEAVLPGGPPSFHGQVFNIRWAVRLRLGYLDGEQFTWDLPFILCDVAGTEPLPHAAE
jgi:hypothetical protein